MKLLLFIDNLGSGGAQRQLIGLAVMLKQYGYEVKVCTYYPHDFYKYYLDENNVPNEIIPNASDKIKRILSVVNFFKREKPDWVIAYQETPSLIACVAKLFGCKYKLIVSERNTTQSENIISSIRFFLYHWANAIVPNSYTQENYLINHHPWMASKLKTITNFVDIDTFSPIQHRKRKETPLFMVAATISKSKNTIGLIEALKLIKDLNYRFKIKWYGYSDYNIDYYKFCINKIAEYELEEYIELLPKTINIKSCYDEADYFCLPSFYEGTPNVICEAISCGIPVLCSDICDNSLYVVDGQNGILFDPYSSKNIANAIVTAIEQTDIEYTSYSLKSRLIAEEKLSKTKFINQYIEIIKENN